MGGNVMGGYLRGWPRDNSDWRDLPWSAIRGNKHEWRG